MKFTGGTFMKLSELYSREMNRSSELIQQADEQSEYFEGQCLRSVAQSHELAATDLAHCIARWGDAEIADLNLAALWADASSVNWICHNHWQMGLRHVIRSQGWLNYAHLCV